jgi:hypothetical protein
MIRASQHRRRERRRLARIAALAEVEADLSPVSLLKPVSNPRPPRPAGERRAAPAVPPPTLVEPTWRAGDAVHWHGYIGTFLQDADDDDGNAEVLIGTRTYRIRRAELRTHHRPPRSSEGHRVVQGGGITPGTHGRKDMGKTGRPARPRWQEGESDLAVRRSGAFSGLPTGREIETPSELKPSGSSAHASGSIGKRWPSNHPAPAQRPLVHGGSPSTSSRHQPNSRPGLISAVTIGVSFRSATSCASTGFRRFC